MTPAKVVQSLGMVALKVVAFSLQYWSDKEAETLSKLELDPVGSTVRYEMMKLCTGSV